MTASEHVSFALLEGFTHIAFSCAVDPLRIANLISEKELYSWSYASENGEAASSSDSTVVLSHHSFADMPDAERLFGKISQQLTEKSLMEMCLERARNLLLQTELSVLNVAIACGFHSAGHFSRTYRTAFGVSPTAQRDRIG